MAEGEPGAVDNLLTIDPSDDRWKETIEKWEDGATYPIKGGSIRQIAPGKFEILALDLGGEAETGSDGEGGMINEPQGANAEAKGKGEYSPAVASMMEEE